MVASLGLLAPGMYVPTNAVMEADERYNARTRVSRRGLRSVDAGQALVRGDGVEPRFFADQLAVLAPGRAVLEYGCGEGSSAFTLADLGARVTGIDISGVRQARPRARGCSWARLRRVPRDERREPRLPPTSPSMWSVGSPSSTPPGRRQGALRGSRASCGRTAERFSSSRWVTIRLSTFTARSPCPRRTSNPLLMKDLGAMYERFGSVDAHFFHLLAAAPLAHSRLFSPVAGTLERFDGTALRACAADAEARTGRGHPADPL